MGGNDAVMQSVLILESNPATLEELSMYVSDCGFRVHTATDLESAMAKLRNHRLPIAIIDWDLLYDAASELIQLIRGNHRLRRTHILVLSSQTDPVVMETSLNKGADDFFSKPINPSELRSRLQWASNRSQVMS